MASGRRWEYLIVATLFLICCNAIHIAPSSGAPASTVLTMLTDGASHASESSEGSIPPWPVRGPTHPAKRGIALPEPIPLKAGPLGKDLVPVPPILLRGHQAAEGVNLSLPETILPLPLNDSESFYAYDHVLRQSGHGLQQILRHERAQAMLAFTFSPELHAFNMLMMYYTCEGGNGGRAKLRVECLDCKLPLPGKFFVRDDADDEYTQVSRPHGFETEHKWGSCETDGFMFGGLTDVPRTSLRFLETSANVKKLILLGARPIQPGEKKLGKLFEFSIVPLSKLAFLDFQLCPPSWVTPRDQIPERCHNVKPVFVQQMPEPEPPETTDIVMAREAGRVAGGAAGRIVGKRAGGVAGRAAALKTAEKEWGWVLHSLGSDESESPEEPETQTTEEPASETEVVTPVTDGGAEEGSSSSESGQEQEPPPSGKFGLPEIDLTYQIRLDGYYGLLQRYLHGVIAATKPDLDRMTKKKKAAADGIGWPFTPLQQKKYQELKDMMEETKAGLKSAQHNEEKVKQKVVAAMGEDAAELLGQTLPKKKVKHVNVKENVDIVEAHKLVEMWKRAESQHQMERAVPELWSQIKALVRRQHPGYFKEPEPKLKVHKRFFKDQGAEADRVIEETAPGEEEAAEEAAEEAGEETEEVEEIAFPQPEPSAPATPTPAENQSTEAKPESKPKAAEPTPVPQPPSVEVSVRIGEEPFPPTKIRPFIFTDADEDKMDPVLKYNRSVPLSFDMNLPMSLESKTKSVTALFHVGRWGLLQEQSWFVTAMFGDASGSLEGSATSTFSCAGGLGYRVEIVKQNDPDDKYEHDGGVWSMAHRWGAGENDGYSMEIKLAPQDTPEVIPTECLVCDWGVQALNNVQRVRFVQPPEGVASSSTEPSEEIWTHAIPQDTPSFLAKLKFCPPPGRLPKLPVVVPPPLLERLMTELNATLVKLKDQKECMKAEEARHFLMMVLDVTNALDTMQKKPADTDAIAAYKQAVKSLVESHIGGALLGHNLTSPAPAAVQHFLEQLVSTLPTVLPKLLCENSTQTIKLPADWKLHVQNLTEVLGNLTGACPKEKEARSFLLAVQDVVHALQAPENALKATALANAWSVLKRNVVVMSGEETWGTRAAFVLAGVDLSSTPSDNAGIVDFIMGILKPLCPMQKLLHCSPAIQIETPPIPVPLQKELDNLTAHVQAASSALGKLNCAAANDAMFMAKSVEALLPPFHNFLKALVQQQEGATGEITEVTQTLVSKIKTVVTGSAVLQNNLFAVKEGAPNEELNSLLTQVHAMIHQLETSPLVSEPAQPVTGGLGPSTPMTAEVNVLIHSVLPELKSKLGFVPEHLVEFKTQVVAGTNYFIKVASSDWSEVAHVRIFEPLPGYACPTDKLPCVILVAVQKSKKVDDPIVWFDETHSGTEHGTAAILVRISHMLDLFNALLKFATAHGVCPPNAPPPRPEPPLVSASLYQGDAKDMDADPSGVVVLFQALLSIFPHDVIHQLRNLIANVHDSYTEGNPQPETTQESVKPIAGAVCGILDRNHDLHIDRTEMQHFALGLYPPTDFPHSISQLRLHTAMEKLTPLFAAYEAVKTQLENDKSFVEDPVKQAETTSQMMKRLHELQSTLQDTFKYIVLLLDQPWARFLPSQSFVDAVDPLPSSLRIENNTVLTHWMNEITLRNKLLRKRMNKLDEVIQSMSWGSCGPDFEASFFAFIKELHPLTSSIEKSMTEAENAAVTGQDLAYVRKVQQEAIEQIHQCTALFGQRSHPVLAPEGEHKVELDKKTFNLFAN